VDDDLEAGDEELEEDILASEDYRAADAFGTTPAEQRQGESLATHLDAEEPQAQEPTWDDANFDEGPDRREGALTGGEGPYGHGANGSEFDPDSEQAAVHVVDDADPRMVDTQEIRPEELFRDAEDRDDR
jgi:hypothetical protein